MAWAQTSSAKEAGTPAVSTKAWPTLMKNSNARAKRSPRRRVEMKTPSVSPRVTLRWQMAWSPSSGV